MGKKGRKTRWRKLPIPIGNGTCSYHDSRKSRGQMSRGGWEDNETEEPKRQHHQPPQTISPSTFNEDEYTKITTPRQDMLFKKGYLGKKKTSTPPQDTTDTQSAGDSVESESYVCDETANQYMYPGGYVDPTGVYYVNNGYEMYDPYTGAVTVIVGPGPQYGSGPQVLTAVPCTPLPLQPLEWFNPAAPQPPFPLPPAYPHRKKRGSVDSQNCSGQSSETTCNPGSPPEPMEGAPDANAATLYPTPYIYPGAYMFGTPLYNMNGVSVQGLVPPCAPPPADQAKRRKKRRRRRRGGAVTDEGSESSCEEVLSCEAGNESQSGASSDTALGSSSSKTNSDSGIHTDPTANSGSDSPQILESNYYYTMSPTENLVEPSSIVIDNALQHVPSTELQAQTEVVFKPSCNDEADEQVNELPTSLETASESTEEPQNEDPLTISVSSETCNDLYHNDEPFQESLSSAERLHTEEISSTSDEKEVIINHEEFSRIMNASAKTDNPVVETYLQGNPTMSPIAVDISLGEKAENGSEEEQCTSDFTSTPASPQTPAEEYYTSDETEPTPVSPICDSSRVFSEPDFVSLKDDHLGETNDQSLFTDESVSLVLDSNAEAEGVLLDCSANLEATDSSLQIEEVRSKLEENHLYLEPEVLVRDDLIEDIPLCSEADFRPPCEQISEEIGTIEDTISNCVKEENPAPSTHARPITQAVTKWLESQGSLALSSSIINEAEKIEEGEDPLTGQKNGEGNPFLASSPSDARTRVAEKALGPVSSSLDWDLEREASRMNAMCDPKSSVNKYYRLAAETTSPDRSNSVVGSKTAVHIGRAGPFPCGICCILQ